MLSKNTIEKLEAKGLKVFGKERTLLMVCKPLNVVGNCIENQISTPIHEMEQVNGEYVSKEKQFETDAPVLSIHIEEEEFRVMVWQWVPGPGPGDFEVVVRSEGEAFKIAVNYFFEKNEHFEAYRNWKRNKGK